MVTCRLLNSLSKCLFLFLLQSCFSIVYAASFTSSLPLIPSSIVHPYGETLVITLPEGCLELPELPDNEYYGDISYEYSWSVPGGPSGTGRTAVIPNGMHRSHTGISSPGNFTVHFSGTANYKIFWEEDGQVFSDGPHQIPLTASAGGQLSIPFWLVTVDTIEIQGYGASGIVSDSTSNMLRGTKYTLFVSRYPKDAPRWPTGYPTWSAQGISINPHEDSCHVTFYSDGENKSVTACCGNQAIAANFNVVTPEIQRVEFHWDGQGIDIHDKQDKWQANIGGMTAINDPACFIQGQKSRVRVKFYSEKSLTFPVKVSIRGDVHWLDEYITGEDYGRDTMFFTPQWQDTGIVESEADAMAKIKDDYDVDISWRYKVRAPYGTDEWLDAGDTDNLRYYLVWDKPQKPQEQPWSKVLEMAVDWAEGDASAPQALGHVTQNIYHSGFLYDTIGGASRFLGTSRDIGTMREQKNYIFSLTECLSLWGRPVTVNCSDTANMVCIFGNALGCNATLLKFEKEFRLNYIKALGRNWTNDPFGNGSQGFSYHHTGSISYNVYDACLKIDNDQQPEAPPHTGLLPVNMSSALYKLKLVRFSDFGFVNEKIESPCAVQ